MLKSHTILVISSILLLSAIFFKKNMKRNIYEQFMRIAIDEAKKSLQEGNKGFGAVIIKKGKMIVSSHDTDNSDSDPTAHAESKTIRLASKIISKDLSGCEIISTHEPCPMCTGAIIWAKISKIIYGVSIIDSLKLGRTMIKIRAQEIIDKAPWIVQIEEGVLKNDCLKLYHEKIRNQIKKFRTLKIAELSNVEKEYTYKRLDWFDNNYEDIRKKLNGDDLEKAYKLLILMLGISSKDAPIIKKTKKRLVLHSYNFCPTIDACNILGLDTRNICKSVFEKSTEILMKRINPNIKFTRNYNKIRPYTKYCEEIIYFE